MYHNNVTWRQRAVVVGLLEWAAASAGDRAEQREACLPLLVAAKWPVRLCLIKKAISLSQKP